MLLPMITARPVLVRNACWLFAGLTALLYMWPVLPHVGYIVEEPVPVLLGLFLSIIFPALPFMILAWHYGQRCRDGLSPSTEVLWSITVSCVATFAASIYFYVAHVHSEDYALISVACMPLIFIPFMVVTAAIAWTVFHRLLPRQKAQQ